MIHEMRRAERKVCITRKRFSKSTVCHSKKVNALIKYGSSIVQSLLALVSSVLPVFVALL